MTEVEAEHYYGGDVPPVVDAYARLASAAGTAQGITAD